MHIRDLVPWGHRKNSIDTQERRPFRSNGHHGAVATLHDELDEAFDRFFERFGYPALGLGMGTFGLLSGPKVDVTENENAVKVRADLPGLNEEDVNVSLTGDVLTIRGDRHREREEEGEGYFLHERSTGAFYRTVPLPPGVEAEKASASFKRGVLEVTIPKAEDAQTATKRIEVKAA